MVYRLIFLAAITPIVGGCLKPSPDIPPYTWTDSRSAIHALCRRSAAVHAVSAECALTLTRDDGESVRLEGAVAMRLPDSVRMRAWKMGQPVFDLTLTPAGLWIESPADPNRRGQILPATLSAANVARAWSIVFGGFFCGDDFSVIDTGGPCFGAARNIHGQRIVCTIDRASLTPERYVVIDADGVERFALSLDRYRIIDGIAWPFRMIATSQGNRIMVELKDTELNGELAPDAFVPPRRAKRIP
ncbi:MAG TPA: hypothetical protein VG326_11615 [Tepidisphaeraceae bacterium]|jgi:hypothetical protein|nr:hypothetical protein [Tepidisphaeraceae bacterium]